MRKSYLLLTAAGAIAMAACSGDKKTSMNDDLKKDLELASSADGITLANSSSATQDVVSAIERTTPPVKQPTPSNKVRRHKPAPKAPPREVTTETRAMVAQIEEQSVAPEPAADIPTPVSPRPQPVLVSFSNAPSSGGDDGRVSTGSSAGAVLGTILGAVIRGGVVGDGDQCDPRVDARRGRPTYPILINQRIPGRVGGGRSGSPMGSTIPMPGRFPR